MLCRILTVRALTEAVTLESYFQSVFTFKSSATKVFMAGFPGGGEGSCQEGEGPPASAAGLEGPGGSGGSTGVGSLGGSTPQPGS